MANSVKTTDLIARAAVHILENECPALKTVYRGYEAEFGNSVNGYEPGDTISIRKPTDFTVRTGATMSVQDVVEGKTSLTVDQQFGVDFSFTSKELTTDIKDLADRVIRPGMVQIKNHIETMITDLYSSVPNWVGTPGETINSFTDLAKAPERLDEMAAMRSDRASWLSPTDYWGLAGSQTGLLSNMLVESAYKTGNLPEIGGLTNYMTQNAPSHTTGNFAGTVLIDQALTTSTTTYASIKDTNVQTIHMDGFTTAAAVVKKGDVFTIDGVYDVNPVSKARLPHLKQFVVTADATMASNEGDLIVSPALIWSGAFQNVDCTVSDLNNQGVNFVGTQSTVYRQNMVFQKNAFALAIVPMVNPPGAVDVARRSHKGISVRVIPVYDGTNDVSKFRLDMLAGVKCVDPRLAVRASGTA